MKSASDWAMVMSELRKSKPRPIAKLYGSKGPTTEQLSEHRAREKAWNSQYRKASVMQKKTLAEENTARQAAAAIRMLEKLL